MKKIERYIYIIVIVILLGVIVGGSIYLLKDNKSDKELVNNKGENKTNDNKDNLQDELDGKYFTKDSFNYEINGKNHVIAFNYSKELTYDLDQINQYYEFFVTVSLDGKVIEDTKTSLSSDEQIIPITRNNIKTIKGTDKDYLVVILPDSSAISGVTIPYILNDNGTIIDHQMDHGFWTIVSIDSKAAEFYGKNNDIQFIEYGETFNDYKITTDAIYYLKVDCYSYSLTSDKQKLDEYKVTIKNGKIEEEKIGEYWGNVTQCWC